jgi:hypothetical protein
MALARRIVASALALLLAAFFGFVGFFKTFAPVSTLARHHAWTSGLPEWFGRAVGVSELAAALALAAGALWPRATPASRWAAGYLILNQACAAAIHLSRGEGPALPQNAVIAALCVTAILLTPVHTTDRRGD